MSRLPDKALLRRGEIMAWAGVSERTFRKVEETGELGGMTLPGCKRKHYPRHKVLKVFAGVDVTKEQR